MSQNDSIPCSSSYGPPSRVFFSLLFIFSIETLEKPFCTCLMQISEMHALRILCTQKHLLNPKKYIPISSSSIISFQSHQNPKFSRHFRSTSHRRSQELASLEADYPSSGISSDSTGAETDPSVHRTWTVFNTEGIQHSDRQEPGLRSRDEKSEVPVNRGYGTEGKTRSSARYGQASSGSGVARGRKKGKTKVHWVCSDCGHSEGQWWGSCRECNKVGTMKQFSEGDSSVDGSRVSGFEVSDKMVRSWLPQEATEVQPLRLTDVNRGVNQMNWRIPLWVLPHLVFNLVPFV